MFERLGLGGRQLEFHGLCERLCGRIVSEGRLQPLVVDPLVGGVLVDQEESVGRFADQIGVAELAE